MRRITDGLLVLAAFVLGTALPGAVRATTVFVMSVDSRGAQIVVNGSTVRDLRAGETCSEGVTLERIEGAQAILRVDGRVVGLGIGQSFSPDIAIRMGADGQFRLTAYLNGVPLRAVIDTGASNVALSSATAKRLGIDYLSGRRGVAYTANGPVPAYLVNITRIQVGEIVVLNVAGTVAEGATISKDTDVLLGNSFLKSVELHRSADTMVIRRANAF